MRNSIPVLLVTSGVAIGACATAPQHPTVSTDRNAERLNTADIQALVVGKSITIPGMVAQIDYHAGGKYGYTQQGLLFTGRYEIADNKACGTFSGGRTVCGEIWKLGGRHYWSNPDARAFEGVITDISPL
ncbi:MAG: hypothetical protein AAFW47_01790 [Pseudomonadota bacterium]